MPDTVIGQRLFTDGVTRPVYLDPAGKQYVVGPDGERVYGVWLSALLRSQRRRRCC
jgi:hypothetical protein